MSITFDRDTLAASNTFMAELDADWRKATGLAGRADYSIAYGPAVPSPLLVLNANPGGASDNFRIVDVAAGEHEYIEGFGPTSQNTGSLLQAALGAATREGIRGVQGSNVIWRRSPNLKALGLSPAVAARETAPFLARFIKKVSPRVLLFGGRPAYQLFLSTQNVTVVRDYPGEMVMGLHRGSCCTFFSHSVLSLDCLPYEVETFTVVHPSILPPNKKERSEVVKALKMNFSRIFTA